MTEKYKLDQTKEMRNSGCQHACVKMAPGSFRKVVEETLGKDLQNLQNW